MNLNEREPLAIRAAITTAVTALVHVAAVYGLADPAQETAIATAVDGLGLLVLIVWGRAGVTRNASVVSRVTTDGVVVAGDAAVAPTGAELDTLTAPGMGPVVEPVAVKPELVSVAGVDEAGEFDVALGVCIVVAIAALGVGVTIALALVEMFGSLDGL